LVRQTLRVLPALAQEAVDDLLERLDRAIPGRIDGFYVVGSTCLGAFRPGRSDLDFVAIVNGNLGRADLARVGAVHLGRWTAALMRDTAARWRWPLVCNGVYLRNGDLSRSPLEVTPLAGHVAGRLRVAGIAGFDVNPVTWYTLAHHGIAVRGPHPSQLAIRVNHPELRNWTLGNLNGYWRRWSQRAKRGGPPGGRALPRRFAVGGVLGAPRLHYTLATGAVASKEAAGRYALTVFERRWHPLIEDALAYYDGAPARSPYRRHPALRLRDAGAFVSRVIDAANAIRDQE
jgi:hypothetical protein